MNIEAFFCDELSDYMIDILNYDICLFSIDNNDKAFFRDDFLSKM